MKYLLGHRCQLRLHRDAEIVVISSTTTCVTCTSCYRRGWYHFNVRVASWFGRKLHDPTEFGDCLGLSWLLDLTFSDRCWPFDLDRRMRWSLLACSIFNWATWTCLIFVDVWFLHSWCRLIFCGVVVRQTESSHFFVLTCQHNVLRLLWVLANATNRA